ncbi:MAG: N-acetylmuramoyl-L-alanine amidase [Lachnospiraceae bacterium]|nr:N-acetylmuramoyl-L-alanine amidase [Lachnospiraceae bacterium]
MKKIRKISVWILVAALTSGSLVPIQGVQAKGDSSIYSADMLKYGDEQNPEEKDPTTESTTEPTTELTTEQTTESTTEQPEAEPVVNPDLQLSKLSPAKSKVIVLDPGHCGKHPGASGHGLREEVVVLDIAQACQSALDKYGDVTVYMTRESGSCCTALNLGECLISRNNYAKFLDADFLVSMHINAGSSSGANVLAAYQSGYHDNIRKETQAFGKIALSNLSKLGIKNRGFLLRKSGTGNKYSNGKLADYYSIVRNGVIQNIPSVIIEHGYVTSSSDCSKFFNTKSKRTKVGKADAQSIVSYYGLKQKLVSGEFESEGSVTYYKTSGGKKAAGWIKDDGVWYYFDTADGKMHSGFLTVGNDTFYLSPTTGEMVVGWFTVNGVKYLTRGNGTLVKGAIHSDGTYTYLFDQAGKLAKKGFHTLRGSTYYVNSKKRVVSGLQKISGQYYGFDAESGQMLYGYQKIKNKYYYFDPKTGAAVKKKIVSIDDDRYYFNASGVQKTGLISYKGQKYYFNPKNGKMTVGWVKIKKKYYYFDKKTGEMQKSKWIGKYYVNSKGVRTKKK